MNNIKYDKILDEMREKDVSGGGGGSGDDIEELISSTAITPEHGKIYLRDIFLHDVFTIDTSGMTASKQVTFELHLRQLSAPVSFTLPNNLMWADESGHFSRTNTAPPDMSTADTLYCIVIRWDGSDLLANLAYTKAIEVQP